MVGSPLSVGGLKTCLLVGGFLIGYLSGRMLSKNQSAKGDNFNKLFTKHKALNVSFQS